MLKRLLGAGGALLSALTLLVTVNAVAGPDSGPTVIGPITGGAHGRPFTSAPLPLGLAGYTEQEYFLRGTATGYTQAGTWGTDGRWKVRAAENAPFETRILVRRPADPARFNGTVIVEWLNVSATADADPDFLYGNQELLRAGYAWVGVSAQQIGVEGFAGLKAWDPSRYRALHHPGDTFSYGIFSKAARALSRPQGAAPLAGLHVRALIADGESQSAMRMVTYANAVQPVDKLFDGFLIHSRGASSAPISQAPQQPSPMPATASDRTDLGVPVLVVETETDMFLPALAYFPATQADGRGFRLWELPGTSHADGALLALTATEAERDIPGFTPGGCSLPANAGQESYVMNAAIDRLTRWVRTGSAPRGAPRMDISGAAFVRDKNGNVLGGVRTPAVDAPTATLTGEGNSGRGTLCFLAGTTTPLTVARLAALYPRHIDYVSAIGRSAAGAVAAGNLLPADALQIDEAAAASPVGLPAPAG